MAAISDVFGGKDQLVREVLLRRIRPINDDRRRRLAALPDDGPRTDRLHALVLAFTDPYAGAFTIMEPSEVDPSAWRHMTGAF